MKVQTPESPERAEPAGAGRPAAPVQQGRGFFAANQSLEVRLEHVARRLAAEYPKTDPATIHQLVHVTSTRLLARSKLAEFIPLFTERHVRAWLDERTEKRRELTATA